MTRPSLISSCFLSNTSYPTAFASLMFFSKFSTKPNGFDPIFTLKPSGFVQMPPLVQLADRLLAFGRFQRHPELVIGTESSALLGHLCDPPRTNKNCGFTL